MLWHNRSHLLLAAFVWHASAACSGEPPSSPHPAQAAEHVAEAAAMGPHATQARVSYGEIETYYTRAQPNHEAAEQLLGFLTQQASGYGFHVADEVTCRGQVCRSVLVFGSQETAERFAGMELPGRMEVMYRAEIADLRDVRVTAYSTVPEVGFQDILLSTR